MQGLQITKSRMKMTAGEMAFCSLFTALIAAGAFIRISIPVQPFPMHFTLQFFFVLLAAMILGARRAGICVGVYLAIGLLGVPVFAAGGGPAYLVRPTFGFLLGFWGAAFVTGWIGERRGNPSFGWNLLASFMGMAVMYLSGMFYFYFISNFVIHMPVTWKVVFVNCCLLTVSGDFLLCVMAAGLARRLKPWCVLPG